MACGEHGGLRAGLPDVDAVPAEGPADGQTRGQQRDGADQDVAAAQGGPEGDDHHGCRSNGNRKDE